MWSAYYWDSGSAVPGHKPRLGISALQGNDRLHGALQVEPGHFVQRQGARLVLEGKPFYFNGFCNYYMLTRAADKRGSGRKEVHGSSGLYLVQHAQETHCM